MSEPPRLFGRMFRLSQAVPGRGRGFGWFVTALPWTIIGLVWVYMLVWMVVLDVVKLALYSRIARGEHRRPHWYARFLKGRSAGHTLATAAQ